MRRVACALAAVAIVLAASPAAAAIFSLADNVDISQKPYTVKIGTAASYTFSYDGTSSSPVSIAMTGTGEVYGNGFFSPNGPDPLQVGVTVPDQLSLGEFFKQTGSQPIPYSIAIVNVAVRFMQNDQTYFGYAQVGGSFLTRFAYNDTPGGSIVTGDVPAAVPEPASWAMITCGFGVLGAALRRGRRMRIRYV